MVVHRVPASLSHHTTTITTLQLECVYIYRNPHLPRYHTLIIIITYKITVINNITRFFFFVIIRYLFLLFYWSRFGRWVEGSRGEINLFCFKVYGSKEITAR